MSTPKCWGRRNIPTGLIPARAIPCQGRVKKRFPETYKYIFFLLLPECSYLLTIADALPPYIHFQPIHLCFSTARAQELFPTWRRWRHWRGLCAAVSCTGWGWTAEVLLDFVPLTHPERDPGGTARAACLSSAAARLLYFQAFSSIQLKNTAQGISGLFGLCVAEMLTIPSVFTNLPTNSVVVIKIPLTGRIQVPCKTKNMKQLCYRLVFYY